MTQTAIALYPTSEEARNVRQALTSAGHDDAQIDILHGSEGTHSPLLNNLALSQHDAAAYREGLRRGNSLVLVTAPDARMNDAVAIMERHNTLNLQERSRAWQAEGWQPTQDEMLIGNNDEMIGNNDEMIAEEAQPQPGTIVPDK